MFKKLGSWFKNLPPELRMLLAMGGLGTPVALIYFIQRMVGHGVSTTTIVFIGIGVVIALSIVGWLVAKLFSRGTSKRRASMMNELTAESSGAPVSMDKRADIKKNNEK